ncbi:uncharacterized protein L201_005690 [Kwoniella dendrophila CBS 6074]|uniref:FAS1 domain-containing protein n=1 Tax=Kwoniella dendrophila CBS 6074 TaxID=1295534 RepID=A0AAX4K112_9TREE
MRFLSHIIPILTLFSSISITKAQLDEDIICPDGSLSDYLTTFMDALYANGLTTFEQLIVHWSETDSGYEFLYDLYHSNQKLTILIPTNEAFQQNGIISPFDGLTEDWGTELGELHILQGDWTYDKLPENGHGVASTSLLIANELNDTESNSNAYQAMILERSTDNTININGWWGNSTSISGGPLDTSQQDKNGILDNLIILPINQVLSFPPSLSTVLESPGLSNMSSALSVVNKSDELENKLTEFGFTIFVPTDSAWTDEYRKIMMDDKKAQGLVGNHYTTSYSLFSPAWIESSTFELNVESGEKLTFKYNEDDSSSIVYGEVEAKIIRSDITLNNGVMHVIDKVLYPSIKNTTSTKSKGKPAATSSAVTVATETATSDNGDSKKAGDKPVIPDAPKNSASKAGLSVPLFVVIGLGWLLNFI